ncbi:MAG: WecB/TagA/CpsF family glycosyltransferase [Deltaproteobacteria bacterium]|nr:WecB/TagA/CpsF family glycosyltransferase [Deltaproteobacteria bacterium]
MNTKAPFPIRYFSGIPIHASTMSQTLDWMETCIQDHHPRFLCTLNAALLVWAHKDPFLLQTYKNADLAVCDSTIFYYALKLLKTPVPEPLEAWKIMRSFIEKNYSKKYRFYFLGAKPDILEKALNNLRRDYSGIVIAGWQHGYFSANEEEKIAASIRDARPDCLFVAMSSPMKERFLKKYQAFMNVPLSLGVGGGIDILAGVFKPAPNWMHTLGLAWFFRLLMEPKRMWKRYLVTNTRFMGMVFKALLKRSPA